MPSIREPEWLAGNLILRRFSLKLYWAWHTAQDVLTSRPLTATLLE